MINVYLTQKKLDTKTLKLRLSSSGIGTAKVSLIVIEAVNVALIAPKNTMFWSDVALKLFPVMVTKVPIIQLVERKRMMVGTCAYANPTLLK